MRILFLTPYFPPEVGAPQTRLYELSVRLARRGHEVTILTGFPNYPSGVIPCEYRGKYRQDETMDGVRVVRTWLYATPNRGFVRRILNHLSYMASAIVTGLTLGKTDVLFVESPPLFDGIAGFVLSKLKRAPMVFNVADLWPQSAVELGILNNPLAIKIAETLEVFIYRQSAAIAAVTRGIERNLLDRGFEQTFFFPNGVDVKRFLPELTGEGFRAAHGLDGKFIVLYAGTHGISQGLDVMVEAARLLQDHPEIMFLLIGDGAAKPGLMRLAAGLPNIRFLDSLPKSEMPEAVAAANVYAISLKDLPLFRGAVPSKTYEAMACAKPIVLSASGEAVDLLNEAEAGIAVPPENPAALADAVRELLKDPEGTRRYGEGGRRMVESRYDRELLTDRFEAKLTELAARAAMRTVGKGSE